MVVKKGGAGSAPNVLLTDRVFSFLTKAAKEVSCYVMGCKDELRRLSLTAFQAELNGTQFNPHIEMEPGQIFS